MTPQVLVIGPGYVGREIIDLLLIDGKYAITALVRRQEAAKQLENDGVNTVLGDASDAHLVKNLTEQSDIVFHTAGADHLVSVQAILQGIEKRASLGKKTIYLHQSGAGVLSDTSPGNNVNNEVYSDKTADQIDSLADTAPHRSVDLAILATRRKVEDKAKIFIFMPPIIYGNNKKYKRLSIQIPALVNYAIKRGSAGYVGAGEGAWGVVHVLDLARAYVQVLHWVETTQASDKELQNPYFFCESAEVTWGHIGALIGNGLQQVGRITTAEPEGIKPSEYSELYGEWTPDGLGCNARHQADRLRSMGWKSKELGVDEAFEKEDLPVLLSRQ